MGVDRVRALQRVLYRCAKQDKDRRFHALYDKGCDTGLGGRAASDRARGAATEPDRTVGRGCLPFADVVKLDILELGRERLAQHVAELKRYGVTVLAEKIETHGDHACCLRAGCDLFQRFFYCRPELLSNRRIDANSLLCCKKAARLRNRPGDRDFDRAEALVKAGDLLLESIVWASDAGDPLFDQIQTAA
jgi:hypothetical protein